MERAAHWYDHAPKGVVKSDEIKVRWDFMIQCDHHAECRKPNIVVVEKEEKKCLIVDIAIPDDKNVGVKEEEKVQKYDELKWEIKELWSMKRVDVLPKSIGKSHNSFTSSLFPVLSLECVHTNFPTRHNGMNTLQREYWKQ